MMTMVLSAHPAPVNWTYVYWLDFRTLRYRHLPTVLSVSGEDFFIPEIAYVKG